MQTVLGQGVFVDLGEAFLNRICQVKNARKKITDEMELDKKKKLRDQAGASWKS